MQRQRTMPADRRYTDEEVGEIIRIASRLDDAVMGVPSAGLSLVDVRRIASELGIADSAVAEAVARHAVEERRRSRFGRLRRVWRLALNVHLFVYATGIVGMAGIDLVGGGGLDFVQYPLFGWGILVAWHAGLTWLLGRNRS